MFILYLNIKTGRIGAKVFLTDEPEPLFLEEDAYQEVSALICVVGLD